MKSTLATSFGRVTAAFGLLLSVSGASAQDTPAPLRTYTQDLTIEFASPEEAARARLAATPVFEGKQWAFSARWDDNSNNNVPVQAVMAKCGLKGTFYLNQSRGNFGVDYARKLASDGCDIGGHTQTHQMLYALLPNEVFYEVLANRVQREADVDRPIHSFALPAGAWRDSKDSLASPTISRAVVRAGFHNTPYLDFARTNPNVAEGELSTGHQVVPGDHLVNLPQFYKQVDRVVAGGAARTKDSYCIHMGVHARQTGVELKKLEEGFRKYAGNPDWWYCTMTEYGAYERQVRNARIEAASRDGAKVTYRITRVAPSDLGSDVPLTLEVSDAAITSATGQGFACDRVTSGRVLLNLHHGPAQACPTRIDVIDNLANAPAAIAASADAPALQAWLYCDSQAKSLRLSLRNTGAIKLQNVAPTLRLPLLYVDGVRRLPAFDLAPNEEKVIETPLGIEREEPVYREGRAYFVAEMDYRNTDNVARLYATSRLAVSAPGPNLRDAVRMAGPFAQADVTTQSLVALSAIDAPLTDIGQAANLRWFATTDEQRIVIGPDRVVLYRKDADWKKLAGALDGKPQCFAITMDFTLSQPTKLKLVTGAKPLGILLNGAQLPAGAEIDAPAAGKNRLVLLIQTNDQRAVWTAFPLYLRLEPQAGTLQYQTVAP